MSKQVNERRKLVIALGAGALAASFHSLAQQPGKVWRVGFLSRQTPADIALRVAALKLSLRELGYVEGKNIVFEERWALDDIARLPELAGELVRAKCDVIVTSGSSSIRALKAATTSIPILMTGSGDAVRAGHVASLAKPGGNVTGLTTLGPELYAKRVELLKEAIPHIKVLAHLKNPNNPSYQQSFAEAEKAAEVLKMKLVNFDARTVNEVDPAFGAMALARVDALFVSQDSPFTGNEDKIALLAAKHRLPSVGTPELAEAGGMLGYGANAVDSYRRIATFVDKILKGAKPANLPVEQPIKFDLIVNMKTAKALGIKFPNSIMVRADKLID